MARTNNLTNFLTDVASAIKTKKGSETSIPAANFDTEILALPSQGTYQTKSVTITSNTTTVITPDQDYDAMDELTVITNVPIASLQTKSYTFTSNQTMSLLPDTGYDGFSSVGVTINVPATTVLNVEDGEVDGTTLIVDVDDIYEELEYIESTGTQYIDTNVLCKSSLRCQLKFSTKKHSGNCYIGGIATNEEDSFRVFTFNDKWYLDFGSGEYHNRIKGGSANINTVYNIEIGNRYIKDLDTGTNIISDSVVSSFTKVYNCLLSSQTEELTIYNCKIYDNDVLIRDFIPVKMNYNNAVGMYDRVNNLFYGNMGTGSFVAGPKKN